MKIKHWIKLLGTKGARYTYNALWFRALWESPSLKRFFLTKLFSWRVPYPPFIEIEVTTRCNLKCTMCEHTYWNEPNRNMSFDEFKKIIDQFKLKWIGLTGIGESLLNPDFLKMLEYCKTKSKGSTFIELYDNFYFIDEKTAKKLIEMEIDKIFISLDAATKQTYEKIRVGSNFDRVINNVRNFIKLKQAARGKYPRLDFHFIISKQNIHEVLPYIKLVHSLRNKEKVSIQFTRMLHEFKETADLFVKIPEELVLAAKKRAKEFNIQLSWNANVPANKPPISQCTEWIMPFVFVTGHVIPCCSGNEAGQREFQKKYSLGNIFEKPFKEIWYGEKYKKFRQMIHEGKVPIQCRNCCLYDTTYKK